MEKRQKLNKNTGDIMRFAGWGTQLFVLLALAVWGGGKLDKIMGLKTPLFVWVLPFIALVVMIYSLIKETSKRK